jgi:hypothetical protein
MTPGSTVKEFFIWLISQQPEEDRADYAAVGT